MYKAHGDSWNVKRELPLGRRGEKHIARAEPMKKVVAHREDKWRTLCRARDRACRLAVLRACGIIMAAGRVQNVEIRAFVRRRGWHLNAS